MMTRLPFLTFCIILLAGCAEQPAQEQSPEIIEDHSLDGMGAGSFVMTPQSWLDSLASVVTNIDYIFFNLDISMAMTDPPAIRSAFMQMDTSQPVPLAWDCPAIARIFYVSSGETVAMSELHFAQGCTYLRFYENDVLTTSVRLNEMGIKFLLNLGVPYPKMQVPTEG